MKLYADRKPWDLEPYYSRHVSAMTTEQLHAKAAIAAELAFRDAEIERLKSENAGLKAQVSRVREQRNSWERTSRDLAGQLLKIKDDHVIR
jgi:FtsZ-binding cell division protein ZapB